MSREANGEKGLASSDNVQAGEEKQWRAPSIGILTIGDELMQGRIVDSHSSWLSKQLYLEGYTVSWHQSIGDGLGELGRALKACPCELVIIAGGLGPTEDDRTRSEIASLLGEDLVFDEASWKHIEQLFSKMNLNLSLHNRSQAYFPASAKVIDNAHGTAPAFFVPRKKQFDSSLRPGGWWALPGVPMELQHLFEEKLLPQLRRDYPLQGRADMIEHRFYGVPESSLDAWICSHLSEQHLPNYHICADQGEIEVRLARDYTNAEGLSFEQLASEKYSLSYLGNGHRSLKERLLDLSAKNNLRWATAESCTAGMVSGALSDLAGSSACLLQGWTTYCNESKISQLNVPADYIKKFGAVSAHTATAMALGALRKSGANIAVSTTGIAGPGGGSEAKPIGTVFFGLALDRGEAGVQLFWSRRQFKPERKWVRIRSVQHACFGLYLGAQELVSAPLESIDFSIGSFQEFSGEEDAF